MTIQHRASCLLVLLGLLGLPAVGQDPPSSPAWQETLDEGRELLEEGKGSEAIKAFKKADKMSGGTCVECQLGLAAAFNQLGAHNDALKNTQSVIKLTNDTASLIRAHHHQGLALFALAGDDMDKLKQAEAAFRRTLELSQGKANTARFNLGMALLRQSRDAEGVALLKEYLEKEPESKDAEYAKSLIENPVRARKNLIPDFEAVTLAGDYLTSEDLAGKVVLLDFWFTSCPPCVKAVPGLRRISRKWADDPFVLVSVSTDQDQATLREFIAKNGMEWPQVWDKDHELVRKLRVESYPTYLLVNHDGEIVYSTRGWSERIDMELAQKVAGAVKAAKKSTAPAK